MTEAGHARSKPKCTTPADDEVCVPRHTAGWNVVGRPTWWRSESVVASMRCLPLRVPPEGSTGECYFRVTRQDKMQSPQRSGAGCAATLVGRLPSAANVHELAKRVEPEGRAKRHGQNRDQPSSKTIFQQIPDPAPESGGRMAGPVLVPVSLPASDLTQELLLLLGDHVVIRRRRRLGLRVRSSLLQAYLRILDEHRAPGGIVPERIQYS